MSFSVAVELEPVPVRSEWISLRARDERPVEPEQDGRPYLVGELSQGCRPLAAYRDRWCARRPDTALWARADGRIC